MPTNINDATYFELKLIEGICKSRNLVFKHSNDLLRYIDLLKISHKQNAQDKMNIQNDRIRLGLPIFLQKLSEIEAAISQKLIDVNWVGRQNLGTRVADIDLIMDKNKTIPISAKSGGPGTERNLGGKSLAALIDYNSKPTINEMKKQTLAVLENSFPGVAFGKSWTQIRSTIDAHPKSDEMRDQAAVVGNKFQQIFADELLHVWNMASDGQRMALLKYISLQNDIRDFGLKIFVASDQGAYFRNIMDISGLQANDLNIIRHLTSSNGTLELLVRNVPRWRMNVNFTNGLGLSPLAVRIFVI